MMPDEEAEAGKAGPRTGMPALSWVGTVLVGLGLTGLPFGILVAFEPSLDSLAAVLIVVGSLHAFMIGLVLQAIERILRAAEEIAHNTAPLLTLARSDADAAAAPAPFGLALDPAPPETPSATHPAAIVLSEGEWRGRRVRKLSDGTLECVTATGWRRFNSLGELEDYVS